MAARRSSPVTGTRLPGRLESKLAAIDEAEIGVEEKKVWSASRFVGTGHGLRLVV